eukprot:CAMPEP_0177625844 /NCGR_PEP_ID=MMETSP0419_2-20121207/30327_1 /TAXON_ID=582737 /ORGANISM="Tetraselmis sp., Strain GSL018" /LENGTH=323 /DNA_ID=CAMNT_0019126839 /DNA_START=833 /DNA_END=1801 /DNA_ORIENTATION=-
MELWEGSSSSQACCLPSLHLYLWTSLDFQSTLLRHKPSLQELKSSSLPEDGSSRPWADLTESVLTEILQACSLRDACALRTVCRHWQNVHRKLQLSLCPPGPLNSGALLLAAPYARGLSLSKAAQAAGGDILPTELGALSGFRHLRSLSLAGCKAVSAEALSALSGLGHTVASLDLSGCSGVDDTVLSKILGGRGLSGLLELDLSDCEQWTAPGLASALSQPRAPQLRTLARRSRLLLGARSSAWTSAAASGWPTPAASSRSGASHAEPRQVHLARGRCGGRGAPAPDLPPAPRPQLLPHAAAGGRSLGHRDAHSAQVSQPRG